MHRNSQASSGERIVADLHGVRRGIRSRRKTTKADYRRTVDLVGGLRKSCRRSSRRRRGRRRLDSYRRHGRPLRAEYHDRAADRGDCAPLYAKAAQRASDDRRTGTPSRRLCEGRCRSSPRPRGTVRHDHAPQALSQIHDLGKKAGAVLNPASPIEPIEHVLSLCDIVLVMTVNAGFGGQKFLPETLPKIRRLRQLCETRGLDPIIEVDGGENCKTAGQTIEAGANAIVAGSAIFGSHDYAAAISAIRNAHCRSDRRAHL